jgi:hypothetical protein
MQVTRQRRDAQYALICSKDQYFMYMTIGAALIPGTTDAQKCGAVMVTSVSVSLAIKLKRGLGDIYDLQRLTRRSSDLP